MGFTTPVPAAKGALYVVLPGLLPLGKRLPHSASDCIVKYYLQSKIHLN